MLVFDEVRTRSQPEPRWDTVCQITGSWSTSGLGFTAEIADRVVVLVLVSEGGGGGGLLGWTGPGGLAGV